MGGVSRFLLREPSHLHWDFRYLFEVSPFEFTLVALGLIALRVSLGTYIAPIVACAYVAWALETGALPGLGLRDVSAYFVFFVYLTAYLSLVIFSALRLVRWIWNGTGRSPMLARIGNAVLRKLRRPFSERIPLREAPLHG